MNKKFYRIDTVASEVSGQYGLPNTVVGKSSYYLEVITRDNTERTSLEVEKRDAVQPTQPSSGERQ